MDSACDGLATGRAITRPIWSRLDFASSRVTAIMNGRLTIHRRRLDADGRPTEEESVSRPE